MQSLSATELDRAAALLLNGGLVAFPTETVYGLGADASNASAVSRIFEVKGRPKGHPLIVHAASLESAMPLASEWSETARELASAFWPGPLTLIFRPHHWPLMKSPGVSAVWEFVCQVTGWRLAFCRPLRS